MIEQVLQDKTDDVLPYKTARGTIYIIAKNLVLGISGAIFFILIARYLPSTSDLGLIHSLTSLVMLGVTVAGLGLTNAVSRFISYHIGAGRESIAKGISTTLFVIGIVSSGTVSIAIFCASGFIARTFFHDLDYVRLIQLTSIDVFLFSVVTFITYILSSLQEYGKVAIISIFNSLLKAIIPFVLLVFGMGLVGIITGFIVGDFVSLIILVNLSKPQLRGGHLLPLYEIKSLFQYSMPMYGSYLVSFLSVNIDYYLLLFLTSLSKAGIYSPAVFLGAFLLAILASFDQSILPYFSRVYGKSGIESLKVLPRYLSRYLFLIFFPVGLAILSCTHPIIIGFFGDRYSESIYPSVIITLTIILTSLGSILNIVLMSAGHSRIIFVSTLMGLSVQLIVSITTIPLMGAMGAAVARSAAYTVMFIYPAYRLKQIAGLHYDQNAFLKGLAGSVIMASLIFILNFYLSRLYYLPFNLFVGFLSYLIFLRLTRTINVEDLEIVSNILAGKLKRPVEILGKIVIG